MQGINKKQVCILAAATVLLAGCLTVLLLRGGQMERSQNTDGTVCVHINEIMASNSAYPNGGVLCDWVEVYNASSQPFDLSGYGLSDDTQNVKYTFPDGTILPGGGYLVVSCIREGTGCAPFGLSSAGGETVCLFNRDSVAVETVPTVTVRKGQSQARQTDGSFLVTDYATPGFENTPAGLEAWKAARGTDDTTVAITELMAANKTTLPDGDGDFSDWVELTNTGKKPWDLTGYYLSDEEADPMKWPLPPLTLNAGERVVIFCSGKNRTGAELHTDFTLSRSGGTVYLTSPTGLPAGSFTYGYLEDDQAAAAETGGVALTWAATPGFENTGEGREAFLTASDVHGPLVIAEAAVSNFTELQQPDGGYYDWVELQNVSGTAIELSDYTITTNLAWGGEYRLPPATLAPGERYVLICSGDESLSTRWYTHAPFTLSAEEERLYLLDDTGALSDRCLLRDIPYGGSMGRMEGKAGFFLFSDPTPGQKNTGGFRNRAAEPRTMTAQGVYNGVETLEVALEGEGTIHYTLDGSMPTASSPEYKRPFVLEDTTIIRAVSAAEGKLTSAPVTFSFIINEEHQLPVISLVSDPDDFFKGVYENAEDREAFCDAHVTFFDAGGGFDTDCSVELHGLTSRVVREKKSMKLEFRNRYGGDIRYDVFGTGEITGFGSLLLRTGTVTYMSILRDEVAAAVAREVSDTVLALDTRYCVLYINGEYWGLYAIREDYSKRYVADHTGSSPDSVTVVKAPVLTELPGAEDLYRLLLDMENYGVADPVRYAAAAELFDMEALCDWMFLEAYFNNNDVAGNIRYIRGDNTGGKWRIAFFDFDLGLANGNADWMKVFDGYNQIGRITTALCKNESFRALLLERICLMMENGLNEQTVQRVIRDYAAIIDSEVERDTERWEGSTEIWQNNLEAMLGFFTPSRMDTCLNNLDRYLHLTAEEWAQLDRYR